MSGIAGSEDGEESLHTVQESQLQQRVSRVLQCVGAAGKGQFVFGKAGTVALTVLV